MKTQEQIIERITQAKDRDPFSFEWGMYLSCLTFDNIKQYLKEDITQEELLEMEQKHKVSTIDDIKREMAEYLDFAWDKCENERGISANRSIMHYQAWFWLIGEDGWDDLMDDYRSYGRPQLERIQKFLESVNYWNLKSPELTGEPK
jgi:hypothetical protein